MSPQRENSAAGPSNIPQKQLQNRRCANDLDAFRMLCPSHGVANRSRLLWTGSRRKRLGGLQKHILGHTAVPFDHFRGVTGEVPLQHLKYAEWIFQRDVPFKVGHLLSFATAILSVTAAKISMPWALADVFPRSASIQPTLGIVLLLLRIPAREQSIQIFGVLEILAQD